VVTKDGRKSIVTFNIIELEDGTMAIEKTEEWTGSKNKPMKARILMFVNASDELVIRMECDGHVVNRLHKRLTA
jgi:hypothetical protein